MALTIRPNEEEQKLIEAIKEITGQSVATKAIMKALSDHVLLIAKYEETLKELEEAKKSFKTLRFNVIKKVEAEKAISQLIL